MSENGGSPVRRKRLSPRKHPYERGVIGGGENAKPATATGGGSKTGRSPLKNIQAPSSSVVGAGRSPLKSHNQSAIAPQKKGTEMLEATKLVITNPPVQSTTWGLFQDITELAQPHPCQPSRKPQPGAALGKSTFPLQPQTHRQTITIYTEPERNKDQDIKSAIEVKNEANAARKDFGPIGDNRSKQSTIKIDTDEEEQEEPSWNPFKSVNVTQGVLGQLQPRGLNSSFTEKFESRLGINSEPKDNATVVNDENENVGDALIPLRHRDTRQRGFLTERLVPLFDCAEYITEILKYWTQLEHKFKIKWNYMERHVGISHKMRTILIDWLVEVVTEYELQEETLHLAVNYIDRFLSKMNVKRTKLQLVGAAALFIAAKFEEMSPPEVSDFVFVTDEAYTKNEILSMEACMLTCLEFDLMMPTAHSLALSYCSLLNVPDPGRSLVMYLVDLSLMDGDIFLKYLPSTLAGSAVALARFVFGGGIFYDADLKLRCGHRKSTLGVCARHLHEAFFSAPTKPQTSLYEKYQAVRYCSISNAFIPNNGPWDEYK